jgi:uncharacterized membrane protein
VERARVLRSSSNINLWRTPLYLTLGSLGLFALTILPDTLEAYGLLHLPFWVTMGGIDDARAILGAMLGCVSTVLALIFSVALLVLSMVSTLFGPRLLYRFMQDWVTQFTIGLFMGTFVYLLLCFLVTHQDAHSTFIPQISLLTSWVLVVASFGFLVFYSHRIASSIQNPDLVARIVDDLAPEVTQSQARAPTDARCAPPDDAAIERQIEEGGPVVWPASGYVQSVDHAALTLSAERAGAVVHLLSRPGQFVLRGEAIARVWPKEKAALLEPELDRHLEVGRHRTLRQDFEFGIAQIVEIALRALSPAINDTFTGVACVDWVGDALLLAAGARRADGRWYDAKGALRLRVRPLRVERLTRLAFDQIRQAAADNPAVLIRMLDVIRRIAPTMQDGERVVLQQEADAIREASTARVLVKLDRDDVDTAWERASRSLTSAREASTIRA